MFFNTETNKPQNFIPSIVVFKCYLLFDLQYYKMLPDVIWYMIKDEVIQR